MCGICGTISKKNIPPKLFDEMTDSLTHRGPNDRGAVSLCADNGWNINLGHRRLSIIDLSENGHQPMQDDTGRYTIVFNGEIYNFTDLKKDLSKYQFKSGSDTEVLLYSYMEYGTNCLERLNGMFAFAIYDKSANTLFMARDRMGEKPLYYFVHDDEFLFASELKPIMMHPSFTGEINRDSLMGYFCQNTILSPYTVFKDTYKLAAGEYLIWKDGNITKDRYYDPIKICLEATDNPLQDYDECKAKLKDLLYDSVGRRLISDVPFGTFLSGGIDSTLISAIAKEIKADEGIDTFSIGFEDSAIDESAYAAATARYLGTRHHEKIMSDDDLMRMLDDMVRYYDEPFSDSSQLPTMLVSEFAAEHVTVVLSGDGGDELFAGYSSNDAISKLEKLDPFISIARALTPGPVASLSDSDHVRELLGRKLPDEKIQYFTRVKEDRVRGILKGSEGRGAAGDKRIYDAPDWITQRMLLDLTTYLPDELMTKVDRASMRFSLETRCPILDHRIVNHSFAIPLKYKYADGDKKHILKDILYEHVPKEMMDRPKSGFVAPVRRWLLTKLDKQLEHYCEPGLVKKQGIFDTKGVSAMLDKFRSKDINSVNQIVWSYYVFQMWHERYMGDI